jgi:23S rRNA (pseudouridine1915-N3)-methyltransferase
MPAEYSRAFFVSGIWYERSGYANMENIRWWKNVFGERTEVKFSDIEREKWEELKPYLDTALIPLSGLTGGEQPWEATEALERLRDAMDPIEKTYYGRIVTYPAVHYAESDDALKRTVNELCRKLLESGFKYCMVVAASGRLADFRAEEASIVIAPPSGGQVESQSEYRSRIRAALEKLWFGGPPNREIAN